MLLYSMAFFYYFYFMEKKLKLYPIIILVLSVLVAILTHTVRHYFNIENQILILIIASMPSFAAVLGLSMIPIIINSKKPLNAILGIATGLIIYELEQFYTSRTFDINDIAAIILGTIIGYFIIKNSISERTSNN